MSAFNLATYTLQVFSPESEPAEEGSAYRWSESDARVKANLPAMLEALEEDLTSLLPEGYRCIIKEWNAPGPGYQPAGLHWTKDVPLQEKEWSDEEWRSGLWRNTR